MPRVMPEALEEWRNLDDSAQAHLMKPLAIRVDNPRVPPTNYTGPLQGATRLSYGSAASGWCTLWRMTTCVGNVAVHKREDRVV